MFEGIYNTKEECELNWYSEKIPLFLQRAVELLGGKGKALDIGCGAGVFSAFMAHNGLKVTALDYSSKALELAKAKADSFGVNISFVHANVVQWQTTEKYELVFDRGCLHNIRWGDRTRYKKRILEWMASDASYILVHFGKEHLFNLALGGPVKKTPKEIEEFFSPELELKESSYGTGKTGPLFHYWFALRRGATE